MTLAYWCVLVAILLPYLCTATAKFTGGDYGPRANSDPRAFLAGLEGWRKRASNAQLNGFEVTPAFAAAVIIAHQAGGAGQLTTVEPHISTDHGVEPHMVGPPLLVVTDLAGIGADAG